MLRPTHFHLINKAIPASGWTSIRERVAQVANALEDNRMLTVNLPQTSKHITPDQFQFCLQENLFTVYRKWPKDWYGAAQIRSATDCTAVFDVFQRAALLLASHYARVHSVEFKIITGGSYEGWCLAAKLLSLATDIQFFEKEKYVCALVDSGNLAPVIASDGNATWAVSAVDEPLFAIATDAIIPAKKASPALWREPTKWFF
jgi:hypothetical protein